MKFSITLSILILVIGSTAGFLHLQQLVSLRNERLQLAAQAVKAGVRVGFQSVPAGPRLSKHHREGKGSGTLVIDESLGKLATEDPRAAFRWIEENAGAHPELANDGTKCSVLARVAQSDPSLAFRLLVDLGIQDMPGAFEAIVGAGRTSQERAAILTASRDHLATIHSPSERTALREEALGGLARSVSDESFETVVSWISSEKLSPEEQDFFAAGISYDTAKAETGKWIDWMAQALPADKLGDRVGDLVGQWTEQDYLAAGQWLAAAPEGPVRNFAVKSYALTVAEYEPQVAAQWALTLPAGDELDATLKGIYEYWPKNDPAGAAAFAAGHGIK
ncbi:MAG: hypothetical protein ABI600_00780 [Luteolibacter sp.]